MEEVRAFAGAVMDNVERVIVDKRATIELMMVALLCDGHVLIEDVPGVGKTMLARAFKRLQCAPDLLPNDVTGVSVFNQKTSEFEFRPARRREAPCPPGAGPSVHRSPGECAAGSHSGAGAR